MSSSTVPTASEQPTPPSPGSSLPRCAKPLAGLGRSCSAPLIGSVSAPMQTRHVWKIQNHPITFLSPRKQQGAPCLQNIAEEEDAEPTEKPALKPDEHTETLGPELNGDTATSASPLVQVAKDCQHDVTAPATPVVGNASTPAPAAVQASASDAQTEAETDTETESVYLPATQDYDADDDSSSIASHDTFYTVDDGKDDDNDLRFPPGFIPGQCYTGGIAGWMYTEDRDPYEVFAAAPIEDPVVVLSVSDAENWGWAAHEIVLPVPKVCLRRLEAIAPGISGMDNAKLSKVRISVARALALWQRETPQPEAQPRHVLHEREPQVSQTSVNTVHELPPSSSPLHGSSSDVGLGHNSSSPSQMFDDILFGTMPGSYYPASTASSPRRSGATRTLGFLPPGSSALPSSLPLSPRRHNILGQQRYNPYGLHATASSSTAQHIAVSVPKHALAGPGMLTGMGMPCHPRRRQRMAAPANGLYPSGMSAANMHLGHTSALSVSSAMPAVSFGTGISSGSYASGSAHMVNHPMATLAAAPTQGPSGYQTTEGFGPTAIFPASSLADNNGVIPVMYSANSRGSVFQQQPQNFGPANGFMGGQIREDVMLQRFLPSDLISMPGQFIEDRAQAPGDLSSRLYGQTYQTQNAGLPWNGLGNTNF